MKSGLVCQGYFFLDKSFFSHIPKIDSPIFSLAFGKRGIYNSPADSGPENVFPVGCLIY